MGDAYPVRSAAETAMSTAPMYRTTSACDTRPVNMTRPAMLRRWMIASRRSRSGPSPMMSSLRPGTRATARSSRSTPCHSRRIPAHPTMTLSDQPSR
jgi:hypothetical protein